MHIRDMHQAFRQLEATHKELGKQFFATDTYAQSPYSIINLKVVLDKLTTAIAKTNSGNFDSPYTTAVFNNFNNNLITLIKKIADSSNLTLDPDLDSYYLMDATFFALPNAFLTATELGDLALSINKA